jgi:hypothetical protein
MAETKTYREPSRDLNVCAEADVVVVGGGPGGHSAEVAAARTGARVALLERYGHLGGMATGGIVIQIPHMSDGSTEQQIAGLCQEWIDRLQPLNGVLVPRKEDKGSTDPRLVSYWKRFAGNVNRGRIEYTAWVDPELTKCILNDMVDEANIKLYLHSWGVRAIAEEGRVKGVIFESKSGRQAVMGKVIIDGTGDGDLLSSAGAECYTTFSPKLRSSALALVFRIGNCDFQRLCDFRESHPEAYAELMKQLTDVAGTRIFPLPTPRNDVVWMNNWVPGLDCTKVEDLTKLEVQMRKAMRLGHAFLKKNVPSFENSFIMDTAPQTGTRGSRRVVGEITLTKEETATGKVYDDTVAVIPRMGPSATGSPFVYFPYRALVPKTVDGLLVAGRSFSSDDAANDSINLIPHCIAIGQAAGTAAAIAVRRNIEPRRVNYGELRESLAYQGVPLPPLPVAGSKPA